MGNRSHGRPGHQQSRLPIARYRRGVTSMVVGLALLWASGCDRAALENAFAPDPQLISEEGGSGSKPNSPGQISGGTASNRPKTPLTSPGGGSQPRNAGQSDSSKQSSESGADRVTRQGDGTRDGTRGKTEQDAATEPGAQADRNDDGGGDSNLGDDSLNQVPVELEPSVADVLALGVLAPPESAAEGTGFEPNEPVTRGTFARWLLAANNTLYGDRPAAQIRTAPSNSQAAFKDVPTTHPDFPAIQGLAEAGIVLSSLSGAQEQINFKPDAPLTREDLLLWKVPLDVREALPSSNIEAVKEAWGFQDVSKVSGPALRAVLADYSNGDQAVIRRVFGYTTLLQPRKPVSQAEAAAALWYFGNGGQGVSAADLQGGNFKAVEDAEQAGE